MSGGRYGPTKAPERRCLPVAQWPQQDRQDWQAACTPTSILADSGGEMTHLASHTRRKRAQGWGRFLTHLQFHEPEALALPAAERLTRQRVKAYVRRLEELGNGSATILCRLQELVDAAAVLAPDLDTSFINRIASWIRAQHRPVREKHNRVMGDEVADLAYQLMAGAAGLKPVDAAVQYRDGLILLLLVHLPLRRKNFTALTLGESLVHREAQWFVCLTPAETKTRTWFEAPVDQRLASWLEDYLAIHRPVLLARHGRWHAPAGEHLWLSSHGSPMTEMALYDRVADRTRAAFGEVISPHRFRDMLASTIASHAPQHIHAAAPLLGHASLRTTEKYYRIARAHEGQKRYVETLQQIRRAHG